MSRFDAAESSAIARMAALSGGANPPVPGDTRN